jgi:hypothetical protein
MDFEKIKKDMIRKVVIGPRSEIEDHDIVNFMKYCGYYDNIDEGYDSESPIHIRKSGISYR